MRTPVMQERQAVSEEHVWQGYWQREQEDPVRKVPEGHVVRQEELEMRRE